MRSRPLGAGEFTTWWCREAAAVALVLIWTTLQLALSRPSEIVVDWNGWRQADTQSIARNFVQEEFSLLKPRIDWRGAGPGYVETELQIYPAAIAAIMTVVGLAEWPGQILSLLFIGLAALVFRRMLLRYHGGGFALAGMALLLSSRGPVFLSTSVQPDALCFLFYTLGLATFVDYLQEPGQRNLWLAVLWTALAGLVKPTALHLTLTQLILVLWIGRPVMRRVTFWLGGLTILLVVAVYLFYAHGLYREYGNTFGIGAAGDSKFPGAQQLFRPGHYYQLLRMSLVWGVGLPGALASVYLFARRRLQPMEWALMAGNVLVLVVALRYTTADWLGSHYHVFTALLGAWLFAHALREIRKASGQSGSELGKRPHRRIPWKAVVVGLGILGHYGGQVYARHALQGSHDGPVYLAIGRQLRPLLEPDDRVIVRSPAPAEVEYWGGTNNYEDPRVLYVANAKGWILPADDARGDLSRYVAQGARYYVEPGNLRGSLQLNAWLARTARRVGDSAVGRIYRLVAPP